ncbi:MAG TPA: hypothetical protein EYQ86_08170 [Bacteroidetes bacterium]|nr:hypothetical protein [Bacteroidota bacterium]
MLIFQVFEKLTDYIPDENMADVEKIVEFGAFSQIKVKSPDKIGPIYQSLKSWEGVDVYNKSDIPPELHYKDHDLIYDILVISNGTVKSGADNAHSGHYLPNNIGSEDQADQQKGAGHGYKDITIGYGTPGAFPDVRSVFMAYGPDFKANYAQQWIKLVDQYQVIILLI